MGDGGKISGGISEEVRILLLERIESYEQLEMLLLLRAEHRSTWNAEMLASRVGVTVDAAKAACTGSPIPSTWSPMPGTWETSQT